MAETTFIVLETKPYLHDPIDRAIAFMDENPAVQHLHAPVKLRKSHDIVIGEIFARRVPAKWWLCAGPSVVVKYYHNGIRADATPSDHKDWSHVSTN